MVIVPASTRAPTGDGQLCNGYIAGGAENVLVVAHEDADGSSVVEIGPIWGFLAGFGFFAVASIADRAGPAVAAYDEHPTAGYAECHHGTVAFGGLGEAGRPVLGQ